MRTTLPFCKGRKDILKGTEDTVYEEAGILADSFSRIPELRQALDNPVLPAETKLKLICEAAGGGQVSEELKRFVELVLEERREKFLQFMIMSYIDLYRKQKNISVGKITMRKIGSKKLC